ncbi:hypothetical protein H4Q26_007945 [Puccinia striiformis f. sp. tritici PST-130]|nr:hypothetical protein H4Q26_007945 [Puccinia striiformis f. sp. tritici PST-130]
MIASHLLLVGLWFVRISIGLTALVDGPNLAIGVNQAEGDTSRSLRGKSMITFRERRTSAKTKWMIPFKDNRRKIVRSEKGRCDSITARPVGFMYVLTHAFPLGSLETIKNWNINRDQVVPLHKYAVRLTKFEAEVQQQFVWLEENKIDVNKMITKASPQDLARAKESFNTIKEGIKVIKNMRLLHLGGAYDIPDDICLALKYESKHPKFQYKEDKRYRLYTLTPLDYAFEIIDFLLEIQFISPEEVREIFQDKKMVEQVVNYTVRQHENDLGFSSWKFMVNLTKHWRWQSMNKFCTALSKKELDRIDLVFLIGRLKCIDALPNALYDSGVLKKGERPFLYEKYFGEYCPGIVSQLSEDEIFSNKLQNLVKPTGNSHKPEDFSILHRSTPEMK